MEFDLSCECGQDISGLTRSDSVDASFQVPCEECGAVYAVTVTQIRESEGASPRDATPEQD